MTELGRLVVLAGVVLLVIGLVIWGLGRAGFRGLPGDVRVEGEHLRFYFPIVTCLVLSAVLTGLAWLWQWFTRR